MNNEPRTLYFLFKVVASPYGKKRLESAAMSETNATKDADCMYSHKSRDGCCVRVGGKARDIHHGIADHFTGQYLNFSDHDNASCKTAAEAEQLAKDQHKEWLADAFDWFVGTVEVSADDGGAKAA